MVLSLPLFWFALFGMQFCMLFWSWGLPTGALARGPELCVKTFRLVVWLGWACLWVFGLEAAFLVWSGEELGLQPSQIMYAVSITNLAAGIALIAELGLLVAVKAYLEHQAEKTD